MAKNKAIITKISILALISSLALLTPIITWASADEHGMGYIEADVEINHVENSGESEPLLRATNHATKVDPRSEAWYQGIAFKNQASTGLCWCFGTTTAIEISYTKETGTNAEEVSPGQLGYFAYNRSSTLTNQLGMLSGCTTTCTGTWYDIGGNAYIAYQALANRTGAVKESIASTAWKSSPTVAKSKYDDSLAYKDYLVLENAELIEESTVDEIKTLIEKYGACTCSVYFPSSEISDYMKNVTGKEWSFNTNGSGKGTNHLVTIIGWDDDYSKDNFVVKPSSDGAWLIQNSWGNDSKYDYPYLWVSYEDNNVNNVNCAYNVKAAENNEYVFEHDGTAYWTTTTLEKGHAFANIFTVDSNWDYKLKSIGFSQDNQGTVSYDVKVYTGVTQDTPNSGTLAASFSVQTNYTGYNTFNLPQAVTIKAGRKYSIIVSPSTSSASMGIDNNKNQSLSGSDGSVTFYPAATTGKSYYASSASATKWTNIGSGNNQYLVRIKGIADRVYDFEIKLDKDHFVYTGTAVKPTVTIDGLKEGTDYTLAYSNNNAVGTGTVTATGIGKYAGYSDTAEFGIHSVTKTNAKAASTTAVGNTAYWTCSCGEHYYSDANGSNEISKNSWVIPQINASSIALAKTSLTYNGSAQAPALNAIKDSSGATLVSGTDYDVTYNKITNVGSSTVVINFKNKYTGTVTKNFSIVAASGTGLSVSLSQSSYTYDGTAKEPTVTVKGLDGKTTLTKGDDYSLAYSNNTNAGTSAKAVITFKGNYSGEVSKSFTITALAASASDVSLTQTSFKYKGSEIKPDYEVNKISGLQPQLGTDYSVSYSDNNAPGTGHLTIAFKGNYSGTVVKGFEIIRTFHITGTLKGYQEGKEAAITISNASGIVKQETTQSGKYSFKYLDGGSYTITVKVDSGDYIEHSTAITLSDDLTDALEIRELGDTNCDGVRSAEDITRLARHIAKISMETDEYRLKLFNTDRNEELNAADITHLARFVAKIIEKL